MDERGDACVCVCEDDVKGRRLGFAALLGLLGVVAGCGGDGPESYLRVAVAFDGADFRPGDEARSRCVKVYAQAGDEVLWTEPMPVGTDPEARRVVVGIARGSFPDTVSVGAVGYLDEACTIEPEPAERSETVLARFPPAADQARVAAIGLVLRRVRPPADGGVPDAGPTDAGPTDAGPPDAGPPDAGPPDAGPPDAGPPDAGPPDAGPPDAGPPDAGPPDAGPPDAGPPDAGPPDAGPPDAGPPDAGDGSPPFPYRPANIPDEVLGLLLDGGASALILADCEATFDTTSDPPLLTGPACVLPDSGTYVATKAPQLTGLAGAFFGFSGLVVGRDAGLIVRGTSPAIVLVRGDALVEGYVLAAPAAFECPPGSPLGDPEAGGGGGGFGTPGGSAGQAANGDAGTSGGPSIDDAGLSLRPLRQGCGGGAAGDTGSPSSGGLGGGAVQLSVGGTVVVTGIIAAPGAGGGGGSGPNKGGAGGGSGGAILLEARGIVFDGGAVTANGGGGGGGADNNGSANPGAVGSTSTSTPAAGGATSAPASSGTGGDGAAGLSVARDGNQGRAAGISVGGGGGGGGLGVVRLEALDGCAFQGAVLVSGRLTSGLADGGCIPP